MTTSAGTKGDVRTLEELLLRMWRIRAFEVRAMELFEEKLIRGSVHPYVGMEAIAVGVCGALRPDDYITSTHRGPTTTSRAPIAATATAWRRDST